MDLQKVELVHYLNKHTIDSKSIRKPSLTTPHSCWVPPKSTAFLLLMAVKVKNAQGGGLGPMVRGEDHLPVNCEIDILENQHSINYGILC